MITNRSASVENSFFMVFFDLGRRIILSLRQNLVSKIHEHDSTNVFKQFKELEGELLKEAEELNDNRVKQYLSDDRHILFETYLNIINEISPSAFVYENVPYLWTVHILRLCEYVYQHDIQFERRHRRG